MTGESPITLDTLHDRLGDFTIDPFDELSKFLTVSKYARHIDELDRREVWDEIVDRVRDMHLKQFAHLDKSYLDDINTAFEFVRRQEVVPSMRSMQFGGPAIFAHMPRMYNCSVRHVDSLRSFAEVFYLLLCGCGVTIGVNDKYLSRLPRLATPEDKTGTVITYVVEDTIQGWGDSIQALLNCYFHNTGYTGRKIVFDYSRIRPKGSPLKTGGGRAPGYEGLKQSHKRIKELMDLIIEKRGQERLKTVDAYDIVMHCADAVLSGGIRRAATAAIFQPGDSDMLNAKGMLPITKYYGFYKSGNSYRGRVVIDGKDVAVSVSKFEYRQLKKDKIIAWYHVEPQRARSNNSILLLKGETSLEDFRKIFDTTRLYGEPGFVFGDHEDQLFNPCYEVGFIPVTEDGICGVQFCNLTSINGSKTKNYEHFLQQCWAASLIGTLQAAYDEFPYLSSAARKLTTEEALLGVSITGLMDNFDFFHDSSVLRSGAKEVVDTNRSWAKAIGTNQAARTTLIKPEGTSSLVLKSSSGIHAHHAVPFYFRRVQVNKNDPVYQFFHAFNPHMSEESIWSATKTDDVITFPIITPNKAMSKSDLNAQKHLDIIKFVQEHWVVPGTTEANKKPIHHNVSATVDVEEGEWDSVIEYVYENRHRFSALSFLAATGDKVYPQAPLEKISSDEDAKRFYDLIHQMRPVDYKLYRESEDLTAMTETVSCAGGACEIDYDPSKAKTA